MTGSMPNSDMRGRLWIGLCGAVVAVALGAAGQLRAAEQTTTASPAAKVTAKKAVHARKHAVAVVAAPVAQAVVTPPPAPVAPPLPDWPINDKPVTATVVWNSAGLRIEAANSSLRQILNDVATATGAKVQGMGTDQRIFGTFGPGAARDVLSQLLDGTGYNVLMIGDLGQGTPRQIVLSARPNGPAPQVANNQNQADDNSDAEDQPPAQEQAPPVLGNGLRPENGPRTPQQIIQEMQQRQQQIEQMQRNNPQ
jgi:hypothetical protein